MTFFKSIMWTRLLGLLLVFAMLSTTLQMELIAYESEHYEEDAEKDYDEISDDEYLYLLDEEDEDGENKTAEDNEDAIVAQIAPEAYITGMFGTTPWDFDTATGVMTWHSGTIQAGWPNLNVRPWHAFADQITEIVISGPIIAGDDLSRLFHALPNVTTVTGLESIDTSNVTNMSSTFAGMPSLTHLGDISGWDTSSVTNMNGTFNGILNLTTLNISGWDTSNVTQMTNTFQNSRGLTELDLS